MPTSLHLQWLCDRVWHLVSFFGHSRPADMYVCMCATQTLDHTHTHTMYYYDNSQCESGMQLEWTLHYSSPPSSLFMRKCSGHWSRRNQDTVSGADKMPVSFKWQATAISQHSHCKHSLHHGEGQEYPKAISSFLSCFYREVWLVCILVEWDLLA